MKTILNFINDNQFEITLSNKEVQPIVLTATRSPETGIFEITDKGSIFKKIKNYVRIDSISNKFGIQFKETILSLTTTKKHLYQTIQLFSHAIDAMYNPEIEVKELREITVTMFVITACFLIGVLLVTVL